MEYDFRVRFPPEATGDHKIAPDDPSCALTLLGELGRKVTKESARLVPALVSCLKHDDAVVVKQSIVSGTGFFCSVLEEIATQLHGSGVVENWLEEIWSWMLKFKDAVCSIVSKQPLSVSTKVLAVKFMEVYILVLSSEGDDCGQSVEAGNINNFDISKLIGKHPILDPAVLSFEIKQCLDQLLVLLKSSGNLCGSLTIIIINCLATIGRKKHVHYGSILSSLLSFDLGSGTPKGAHAASIRHSLRTAFLGFLRCMHHPLYAESRDKLLWALRTVYPGDSTEQIIRQVDRISKNMERISRDVRTAKDEIGNQGLPPGDDTVQKLVQASDDPVIKEETNAKRIRFDKPLNSVDCQMDTQDDENDLDLEDGFTSKASLVESNVAAVEQMIAMIGAMLAEGERGAEPLDILISQIQPELLADIVIVNMKHLPNGSSPLSNRLWNFPNTSQASSSPTCTPTPCSNASETSKFQTSSFSSQFSLTSPSATGTPGPTFDVSSPLPSVAADSRRDPRRDPRRLDPRRAVAVGWGDQVPANVDNVNHVQSVVDVSLSRPVSDSEMKIEISSVQPSSKLDTMIPESSTNPLIDQLTSQESYLVIDEVAEPVPSSDIHTLSDIAFSPLHIDQEMRESTPSNEGFDTEMMDHDHASSVATTLPCEKAVRELPVPPLYVELTDEQSKLLNNSAIVRIIEGYKPVHATNFDDARSSLLARLVAQTKDEDDIISMLEKHIVSDYQQHKGHELAMHVLYYLHTMMSSEVDHVDSSFASVRYEKFLIKLAKSLHDSLPASDKSFMKLLTEVPFLPDSAMKLLEDLCSSVSCDQETKDTSDGDRVTQGLGTVWSLISTQPYVRQACLRIALDCAVHPQDEVRAKAVRLVSNKLFMLNYASGDIEQFAKDKILSLVDQPFHDVEGAPVSFGQQRSEAGSQGTSISGSQNSEPAGPGASESDSARGTHPTDESTSLVSSSQAQRYTSLFFALCARKTSLLQVVFDIYGRAPKAVTQSIHRHVPVLIRNIGSSYSDLLHVISDPPKGSENLLMLVLQILTEEAAPPSDLIATVKHLYETKLKDAAILIPMLSSLSKDEVLPIFPRLVDLPMEKFQTALARILEGSAHTGPALTPSEVLVAIHSINPEKDKVPLKKIMDACTACFEQRTVFTQQVLARSLNHLVDQIPLPLLFMRTVIQAIDAFPALVDFVMKLLSKLVDKQIWKMPKLWVGFLKCASQTQPRSFNVLLQLPPQQLENFLHRHSNLRAPLSAHASQPSIRNSLPRSIQGVLGIADDQLQQHSRAAMPVPFQTSDGNPSVHGAALT